MSEPPRKSSHFITLRNAFFSGALLLAPLGVTVWAFLWVINQVGGTITPLFISHLPKGLQNLPLIWDILGTIIVVALVTALGYVSRYVFGKFFLSAAERFVQGIPGVNAVYNSVKQIVDTFGTQNRHLFNKVVLVEFPRKGVWTIGFLTNTAQAEAQKKLGQELWTVFVPTTPNPTGGYMLMLPPEEIVELEMSVGEGMKLVISGGAVVPPFPPAK